MIYLTGAGRVSRDDRLSFPKRPKDIKKKD